MAATRWLTFDCYGTIADWNSCMLGALATGRGRARGAAARRLSPGGVHPRGRAAVAAVPGDPHRRARAGRAADRACRSRPGRRARWSRRGRGCRSSPTWPRRCGRSPRFGWRLAMLTNCDDDLFASTSAKLPVPFEVVVTAEQVRSYKPDLGALPEVRRADRRDARELDPRRQQLGARHPAGRPDGAALGLGRPRPHRAPGQVRRAADHRDAPPARDRARRERAARLVAAGAIAGARGR